MSNLDAIRKKCEGFLAQMTERFELDGIIIFVNKNEEGVVDVFQAGHPLVNLEMARRFVLINDSEVTATQISEILCSEDGEDGSEE